MESDFSSLFACFFFSFFVRVCFLFLFLCCFCWVFLLFYKSAYLVLVLCGGWGGGRGGAVVVITEIENGCITRQMRMHWEQKN